MTSASGNKLITVDPEELRFQFELEKASHCDLKVSNATDKYVAFKVKTTSPKKYFVRPNTGVIQPRDTSVIRVTLQPQLEYPPDMLCKDKFLLQSTPVPSITDTEELPANTFSKEPGKHLEECKLKVVYIALQGNNNSGDAPKQNSDPNSNQAIQTARAARDSAVREATQLQQELEMLKKRNQKPAPAAAGFSLKLAIVAGIIGILVGFILKLAMASPTSPPPPTPPSPSITD
ncbi:unnamed protein product [Lactuca virosa]|uniref:MSP domain-containing protein n=1 Tax=Lactuca virosa TaxID=75947 RepID=A0AAU9PV44_9ASTR|nr:unnamed protein product [Lactuca virosa]